MKPNSTVLAVVKDTSQPVDVYIYGANDRVMSVTTMPYMTAMVFKLQWELLHSEPDKRIEIK